MRRIHIIASRAKHNKVWVKVGKFDAANRLMCDTVAAAIAIAVEKGGKFKFRAGGRTHERAR